MSASLIQFAPELILAIGAGVLLAVDLIANGRDRGQTAVGMGTIVLALAATLWLWLGRVPSPEAGLFATVVDGVVVRPGAFISDNFTHFFRLTSLIGTGLVWVSGLTFMRTRTPFRAEFGAFLLLCALAMNLMAGANDLILVLVAIEFLSITSYILVGFLRQSPRSNEGGLKYFLYGSITSAAMIFGMTYLLGATGTTSLPLIAQAVRSPNNLLVKNLAGVVVPSLLMVLAGLGFKIALVPFHQWAPDAYEGAPTPVTSFLSVGPKAAGIAVLLRVFVGGFDGAAVTPGWIGLLGLLAGMTMLLGNLAALGQTDIKRLMAYSSIAQAGYMLIGVAAFGGRTIGDMTALGAVLVYILAYVFTNVGLFACIIAVNDSTGSSDVSAFDGLMRRAPSLAVPMVIFFLSLIGVPPLAGFIGKFAVFSAALTTNHTVLAVIGVLTGVIAAVYYLKVVRAMFFRPSAEDAAAIPVSPSVSFVIWACLAMTLLIGIWPAPFIGVAKTAAAAVQTVTAVQADAGHE
ncbi:MAG: NADH-quinone oxidoreductase subunit N [Ardenticatenales bacterium]